MKKKIILCGIIIILIFSTFFVVNKLTKKNEELVQLKVAEVTHSIFYAPLYVAIENGYFADNSIDVELILTPGADKVSAAVLSGDVQIGFCGPESSIYVYNGGQKDYIKSFAGLTKRDGQFIISRKKESNFSLENLKGKEVLAGRVGGMPVLNFENALKNSHINIDDVNINTTVEFSALAGAFIGGDGDYVNLFEPNATTLEKQGYGYVVASIGNLSGEVPYTAFNAKKSYIDKNKTTIKKFSDAIQEGLTFVDKNDAQTIAKVILKQFPDSSLNDITTIVQRYKDADSWLSSPYITEESFKNLENIMIDANLLDDYVPYKDLIYNTYE